MSPSIIIVEVMKEFCESKSWDVNFSLILISHFYWKHPWAGFRSGAEGVDAPHPHLLQIYLCFKCVESVSVFLKV